MTTSDEDAIIARAQRAYFRASPHADYPGGSSAVESYKNAIYAVLRNINGTLAVFSVSPSSSRLNRLKTWPVELDRHVQPQRTGTSGLGKSTFVNWPEELGKSGKPKPNEKE